MNDVAPVPKVSIIVPVYNCGTYLEPCLKSIRAQTFADWELLCIDDGSTDGSSVVLDSHAAQDSRIRVFHCENGGVSRARNRGIAEARAGLLLFHDGDDIMRENLLDELYAACGRSNETDLSVCGYVVSAPSRQEILPLAVGNTAAEISGFDALLALNRYGPWCKMYRKEVIDRCQLRFREDMTNAEDQDFVLRYLLHCRKVQIVHECLMLYVVHPNSANSDYMSPKVPIESYYKSFSFYVDILRSVPPEINGHTIAELAEVLCRRCITMWEWLGGRLLPAPWRIRSRVFRMFLCQYAQLAGQAPLVKAAGLLFRMYGRAAKREKVRLLMYLIY